MRSRRWPWVVLAVFAALWLGKHFLLDTAAAAGATYPIDIEALHRAAVASGPLPERIEVEKVAEFKFPRTIVVAGDGFHMHPMVLLAHRVVGPWGSVVIDTAMAPAATAKMPGAEVDPAAFPRVEKAMQRASAIVFTHEHEDHVGGVAGATNPIALVPHVRMTREQLESPNLQRGDFPAGVLDRFAPLDYSGLYSVAPGVVLQKAPGHSAGSQLIYVELANGVRYLFVGDIAWTKDNIRLQVGRPGIATLLMKEDRPKVAAQLQAIAKLPRNVHVVVAHDPVALGEDLKAGLFHAGFSEP
ncbi:MAG TPA: MBL fold metallo-hydrolase [Polyangiaceae bacterium]|nr:MBL fold metallo-hydrolase [Polyangiaceae bacterium]